LKKCPCNLLTDFLLKSHPNAHSFDMDTTLCPGKLKP
jgi:hypothetical protein